MRVATLIHKRAFKLVGALIVMVCLLYLAFPSSQFLVHYTIRFIGGQHPFGGSPIHDPAHMSLPSVIVEAGSTLCCRMELCDFRFPLPSQAGISVIDPITGGRDTIKGTICVTNVGRGMIDLHAYARSIRRAGFCVSDVSDLLGYDSFTATSPDGGLLQVDGGQPTKITFSFFGDY